MIFHTADRIDKSLFVFDDTANVFIEFVSYRFCDEVGPAFCTENNMIIYL